MITIKNTDGSVALTLVTGENNGPGAVSNPFALSYMIKPTEVYVRGDLYTKFAAGSTFSIKKQNQQDPSTIPEGTYTVASTRSVDGFLAVTTTTNMVPANAIPAAHNLVIPVTVVNQPDETYVVHYHVNGNVMSQYSAGSSVFIYNGVTGKVDNIVITAVSYIATSNKTRITTTYGRGDRPDDSVISRSIRRHVKGLHGMVGEYESLSSTSLLLPGPGSVKYNAESTWGEAILQDLYNLLTNFAGEEPPYNPMPGQLWWNASDKTLAVFNGGSFEALSSYSAPIPMLMRSTTPSDERLFSTDDIASVVVSDDEVELDLSSLLDSNRKCTLLLTQGTSTTKVITFTGVEIKWAGGKEPAWSARSGYTDVIEFICHNGAVFGNMASKGHR